MKKKILAVDDSKAIRFLLQSVLSREYDVITMPDGYSAMYWLSRQNMPDLIIADPQLPDMEDWELIRHLDSEEQYTHIPVLVLSAINVKETWAKCIELKTHGYFLKPFNPIELVNSINSLLKHQLFSQENFNSN